MGYILINNDDDNANGVADHKDLGPVDRENDLIEIWVSEYATNSPSPPADPQAIVHFGIGLQVYRSPDRTDQIQSGDTISVAEESTLYVEARGLGFNIIAVGGNGLGVWEYAALETLRVVGPVFVPDLSTHTYECQAVNAAPTPVDWEADGAHQIESNGINASVLWGSGPAFGRLWLSPTPDFRMPFDVRVIDVAVGAPSAVPAFSSGNVMLAGDDNIQHDYLTGQDYLGMGFGTGGGPGFSGCRWAAKVTLTGPDAEPRYGIDKLRIGFVQNVSVSPYESGYSTPPNRLTSSAAGSRFIDCRSTEDFPWYSREAESWRVTEPDTQSLQLESRDSPGKHWPKYSDRGQVPVAGSNSLVGTCDLRLVFDLWVVASPIHDNLGNSAVMSEVSRQAWAEWWIDGSDVDVVAGFWDQSPAGYSRISLPAEWLETQADDLAYEEMLVDGVTANDYEHSQHGWYSH